MDRLGSMNEPDGGPSLLSSAISGSMTPRRTCASLLVALDVHPRVAMQILRHSQIPMTMEIYSEVPTTKTRSALKRLGRQLDG